jgi:MFS family permease
MQAEPEVRAGWRQAVKGNVLAMGWVSFFTDFSSEMMNPLLPVFIAGLMAPGPEAAAKAALFVGIMEGVAETTAALLKIYSGRLSDRLGKRKALVLAGYGMSSLARPLMAGVASVWAVVGLKFLDRVGKGIRTSPRDALIGDSVGPEYRGLAFSFHRSMDHLGAVLGPLVAVAVLYALLGSLVWRGATPQPTSDEMRAMRILFGIALVPGLLAMATLAWRVREISPKGHNSAAVPSAPNPRLPGRFLAFVVVVTVFALGNSSDLFIVYLGWSQFGLGLPQVIGLWMALHVSKILFSFVGGLGSDRVGRKPVIVAGWLVYALIYLGLAHAVTVGQFIVLVVAYGIYHGMTEGTEKALVADLIPSRQRATGFGWYHGAVGLAALPASVLFGALWQSFGPKVAFGFGAALAGVAAMLLLAVPSGSRREA